MDFGSAKLSEKSIYQSSNLMKETRLLFDNLAINAEVGSLPVCRASRRTNKAQLRKEALRNQRHDSKDHLTCRKVSREVPVACFSLHKVDTGDKVRVGGNYPAVSEFCCRFRVRRLLCAPCGTGKRVQGTDGVLEPSRKSVQTCPSRGTTSRRIGATSLHCAGKKPCRDVC